MSWLRRSPGPLDTLPVESARRWDEAELLRVEKEFRQAELQFTNVCLQCAQHASCHKERRFTVVSDGILSTVNGLSLDPQRAALERQRDNCRDRRNELLRQRAALLLRLTK